VRVLDAVFPRPSEATLLVRVAGRAYAAVSLVLLALALAMTGALGPGTAAGAVTLGFTRILTDAIGSLAALTAGFVGLIEALASLVPLAGVAGVVWRGLEVVFVALSPQHLAVGALTLLLAALILIWASTPARERGVPHAVLRF
jgi:hypothetical protein